jgi:hypothetical protein
MPTLRSKDFRSLMLEELTSSQAERICERRALDLVVAGLQRPDTASARHRMRGAARTVLPRRVRVAVRPDPKASLPTERLAFRLVLASRMATLLTADAAALDRERRA